MCSHVGDERHAAHCRNHHVGVVDDVRPAIDGTGNACSNAMDAVNGGTPGHANVIERRCTELAR